MEVGHWCGRHDKHEPHSWSEGTVEKGVHWFCNGAEAVKVLEPYTPLEDKLALNPAHDEDLAEAGVRALLRLMGEDPTRTGLQATPRRVVLALLELAAAPGNPADLLKVMFDDAGPVDEMVTVGPMPLTSLCEHHLLPFTGHAWVAYIPTDGVVGLSKIPRLVDHFAMRPQVQERLTRQIVDAFNEYVPNAGVACKVRAAHTCASMRGVKKDAPMTTTALTGLIKDDPKARDEFLAACR